MVGNLHKAKNSWERMLQILSLEGEDPKVSGYFLNVVFHAVLMFGAETWVLTPSM